MGNLVKPRQERRRMQFWSVTPDHGLTASPNEPDGLDLPDEEAQVVIVTLPTRAGYSCQ
jgi:hypothetical protein